MTSPIEEQYSYLLNLPNEAIFPILLKLPVSDILQICNLSRRLNSFCQDDHLWQQLVQRDFGLIVKPIYSSTNSWKQLYQWQLQLLAEFPTISDDDLRQAADKYYYIEIKPSIKLLTPIKLSEAIILWNNSGNDDIIYLPMFRLMGKANIIVKYLDLLLKVGSLEENFVAQEALNSAYSKEKILGPNIQPKIKDQFYLEIETEQQYSAILKQFPVTDHWPYLTNQDIDRARAGQYYIDFVPGQIDLSTKRLDQAKDLWIDPMMNAYIFLPQLRISGSDEEIEQYIDFLVKNGRLMKIDGQRFLDKAYSTDNILGPNPDHEVIKAYQAELASLK